MIDGWRVVLAAAVFCVCTGCGPAATDSALGNASERVVVDIVLDERIVAGGTEDDTLFALVGPMFADQEGVVVADTYRGRVVRLSRDGAVEWRSGRNGQGPGEFEHIVALQGVGGSTWALDMGNSKVVAFAADGSVDEEWALSGLDARPTGMLPGAGSGDWFVTASQSAPLVKLESEGRRVASSSLPWDSAAALSPLASQLVSAASVEQGVLFMAFQLGNGLMRFDGSGRGGAYRSFVEPVSFTPVVERTEGQSTTREFAGPPTYAARSLSVDAGRVYVHFGGQTEERLRVIDVYDADTLLYLESFLLPRRVSAAVVHYPDIYATYADPYPTIMRYTIRE